LVIITYQGIESYNNYRKELYGLSDKEQEEICTNIYDGNIKRNVLIIPNVLTREECELIIDEGNNYGLNNSWKKDRHEQYPTVDNEITNEWYCYNKIMNIIYLQIIPGISTFFGVNEDIIGINEIFIAKYEMNGQKKLSTHKDGSEFSFIIALNDDYKGGGTKFTDLNKKVKLNVGSAVIFSGQENHKGISIKQGSRFIVTGFLNIFHKYYCDEDES
tara:strand:+ start:1014 stop:1664 length:651 start_codon:yes stop_codon:yes gene_type:complete